MIVGETPKKHIINLIKGKDVIINVQLYTNRGTCFPLCDELIANISNLIKNKANIVGITFQITECEENKVQFHINII